MRSLAKRLMVEDPPGPKSPDAEITAAFPASDRLRPYLATLMGKGGFRALLLRALALASEDVLWLRAVQVRADGSVEGLEALPTPPDPIELLEGRVVLLAQLLGLLVAFIGPGLTSRLVGETWPHISPADLDFSHEGKNEKTK